MDFSEQYELVEEREMGDIAPAMEIRSERARKVARWFGIETFVAEKEETANSLPSCTGIIPKAGEIVLVMGASGSGKSSLLRKMCAEQRDVAWVDLNEITLPETPIVDCFGEMRLENVLELLSRVGLAEAWSYLRLPSELSEGQRWRLKLAMGMSASPKNLSQNPREPGCPQPIPRKHPGFETASKPQAARKRDRTILVADEFGAVLDRITAGIVARCLKRAIDGSETLGAVVATSHEDLVRALLADVIVQCDFRRVEVWKKRVACC